MRFIRFTQSASPLRRVEIPKPGQPGKTRPLSIPTVRDRVVMTAAKIVLEPIFEAQFLPVSLGFRPNRSAHEALEAGRTGANRGAEWVLDADLTDCFGSIDHDALIGLVSERVSDRDVLKLIRAWLRGGGACGRGGDRHLLGNPPGRSDLPVARQRCPARP